MAKRLFSMAESQLTNFDEFPPIKGRPIECSLEKTSEYMTTIKFFIEKVIVEKGAKRKRKKRKKQKKESEKAQSFFDDEAEGESSDDNEDVPSNGEKDEGEEEEENVSPAKLKHALRNTIVRLGGVLSGDITSPFIQYTLKIVKCSHIVGAEQKAIHDFDIDRVTGFDKPKSKKNEKGNEIFVFEYDNLIKTIFSCKTNQFSNKKSIKRYFQETFSLGKDTPLTLERDWLLANSNLRGHFIKPANYLFKNIWVDDIGLYDFIKQLGFTVRHYLTEEQIEIFYRSLSKKTFSEFLSPEVKEIFLTCTMIDPAMGKSVLDCIRTQHAKNFTVAEEDDLAKLTQLSNFYDFYQDFFGHEKYYKDTIFYLPRTLYSLSSDPDDQEKRSQKSKYDDVFDFLVGDTFLKKNLICVETYKPALYNDGNTKPLYGVQRPFVIEEEERIAKFFSMNKERIFVIEEYGFPFIGAIPIKQVLDTINIEVLPSIDIDSINSRNTIVMTAQQNRIDLLKSIYHPIQVLFIGNLSSISQNEVLEKRIYIFDSFMILGLIAFGRFVKEFLSSQKFLYRDCALIFTGCQHAYPSEIGKPFQDIFGVYKYAHSNHCFALNNESVKNIIEELQSSESYMFTDRISGLNIKNRVYKSLPEFVENEIRKRRDKKLSLAICTPDYKIKDYLETIKEFLQGKKQTTDDSTEDVSAHQNYAKEVSEIKLLLIKHCNYNFVPAKTNYNLYSEYPTEKLIEVNSLNSLIIVPKDMNCLCLSKIGHLISYSTEIFFIQSLREEERTRTALGELVTKFAMVPSQEHNYPKSNLGKVMGDLF